MARAREFFARIKFPFVGNVLGFVQILGSAIAVIMIVVLGIKYMVGSVEEKAEYKKTMIPYAVGAICIFAASNIAKMVYDAVTSNSGGGGSAVV